MGHPQETPLTESPYKNGKNTENTEKICLSFDFIKNYQYSYYHHESDNSMVLAYSTMPAHSSNEMANDMSVKRDSRWRLTSNSKLQSKYNIFSRVSTSNKKMPTQRM